MFGLRKRRKESGKFVWAVVEYDPIGRMWRHMEGNPGHPFMLFSTKKEILRHMRDNELDPMDWEIIKEGTQ